MLRLTALQGPQFGRYDILIDDSRVGAADFRASEETELDLPLGVHTLPKGPHKLTFQAVDVAGAAGEQPAGQADGGRDAASAEVAAAGRP